MAGANWRTRTSTTSSSQKRARWSEIQKHATNLGETLNMAAAALEDANRATLEEGVLAGIDFNDKRPSSGTMVRDNVLARLVQHFSKLNLRNANLSNLTCSGAPTST